MTAQEIVRSILQEHRTIAVVGLSRDPSKDSYRVAQYLQTKGYRIIPINPFIEEILGERCYRSLLEVPEDLQKILEIVDIFRRAEDVPPIVDQAIQLRRKTGNPQVVWMQLGIVNEVAAKRAIEAGLTVVMNKCMMIEHRRMTEEFDPELEKIRMKKLQEMQRKVSGQDAERIALEAPVTVEDSNFDELVHRYPLIVIDCWAPWCGPCLMVAPVIDELARDYAGKVVFGKLNVDENPRTSGRFGIMSIPTLLIMKNGSEIDRIVGAAPRDVIEAKLQKYLGRL